MRTRSQALRSPGRVSEDAHLFKLILLNDVQLEKLRIVLSCRLWRVYELGSLLLLPLIYASAERIRNTCTSEDQRHDGIETRERARTKVLPRQQYAVTQLFTGILIFSLPQRTTPNPR